MASANLKTATDSAFDTDVLQSKNLCLVDFWAEWCGPCRMLAPTIETLADDYAGKVDVFKMNVDENPQTAPKFNIRGIPTVILFKNGQVADQIVGNRPIEDFKALIDQHLN